jgi:hypothetical protein
MMCPVGRGLAGERPAIIDEAEAIRYPERGEGETAW